MAQVPDIIENKFLAGLKGVLKGAGVLAGLVAWGGYETQHYGTMVLAGLAAAGLFALAFRIKAVWKLKRAGGVYS